MIIIQKNYSGGNGRGTLEYNLKNSDEGSYSHAIDYQSKDPYADKEDYLNVLFDKEPSKPETVEEESGIVLKPGQKDPRILDLKPQGIAKARTRVRVPKTIENPVPEPKVEDFNAQADIQEEVPEEVKAGMSGAAKAGLIGAGIAAAGAGGYAAYKAWKKKQAKKKEAQAQAEAKFDKKEEKK